MIDYPAEPLCGTAIMPNRAFFHIFLLAPLQKSDRKPLAASDRSFRTESKTAETSDTRSFWNPDIIFLTANL